MSRQCRQGKDFIDSFYQPFSSFYEPKTGFFISPFFTQNYSIFQYSAQLEQYRNAIRVFEEIALWEADHPTLKYNAKNHFFMALVCYLSIDVVGFLC